MSAWLTREKRDAARKIVAAGDDPAAKRKLQEAEMRARSRETFSIVADEWLERLEREERSESTLSKLRRLYG